MRVRRSLVITVVLSVVLVLIGIWMVIAGWPMQTPQQILLIDVAQLPMAGAALVGIVYLAGRRKLWLRSRRSFTWVFGPSLVLLLIGLLLVVIGYGVGPVSLSPLGQLLIWIAVGLMFTYVAIDSLRRERDDNRTLFFEVLDDDEDIDGDLDDQMADGWFDDESAQPTKEPHRD